MLAIIYRFKFEIHRVVLAIFTVLFASLLQFFTTKPYACEPSSLPKYPPSKEMDAKLRDEEARRCLKLLFNILFNV